MEKETSLENAVCDSRDIVLVAGTSFLKRLSNRNVWAIQVMNMVDLLARQRNGKWIFRSPGSVIGEYNYALEHRSVDDFGIPEAQKSLEHMIPDFRFGTMAIDLKSSQLAAEAWRKSPKGMRRKKDDWKETRLGYADHDARTFAIDLAKKGEDVYFASYDIGDEIRPLELDPNLTEVKRNLTFLPPSKLEAKYFTGMDFSVLTGAVIGKLPAALSTPSYQDCVLFERNVRSGDVKFDAGVGVVRKEYPMPFELPKEFEIISGNSYRVPIVKVKSLEEPSTKKKLLGKIRELNVLSLVVVDESNPFFPHLFSKSYSAYTGTPLLRADLDFLCYQTTSRFGKATYIPPYRRKASVCQR